ncbi:oligosaccharide flippase family protein [Candidatus Woesearchaeota archaeon]|nr:oligosaccharide flippase family protein [Candidatus Woesearchaeota archaeon]
MENKWMKPLDSLLRKAYFLIFGEEPSSTALILGKSMSFVFIGFGLSRLFAFLFQLVTARFLGASLFGDLTLVQTIASFLFVPFLWGVNVSLTKYASETTNHKELSRIVSNSTIIVGLFTVLFSALFYILSQEISTVLNIDKSLFIFAILLALGNTLFTFARHVAQGLKRYYLLTNIVLLRSLIAFAVIMVVFFYFENYSLLPSIIALFSGYIFSFALLIPDFFRLWKWSWNYPLMQKLFTYGSYNGLSVISIVILTYIDNVFVHYFLGSKALGLYQVYYLGTMIFVELFVSVFTTILFPETTTRDKKNIWERINKLFRILPGLYLLIGIVSSLLVLLFGKEYPYNIWYILLFTLSATISLVYYLYASFFNATSLPGSRYATIAIVIAAVINIALNWLLIPLFELYGAIVATIIAFLFMVGYLSIKSSKIIPSTHKNI